MQLECLRQAVNVTKEQWAQARQFAMQAAEEGVKSKAGELAAREMFERLAAETERLAEESAKLTGHQNSRQKIHYVARLSKENMSLKKENARLAAEVRRLQQLGRTATSRGAARPAGGSVGSASVEASSVSDPKPRAATRANSTAARSKEARQAALSRGPLKPRN